MSSKKIFADNIFSGDMGQMPQKVTQAYELADRGAVTEAVVDLFADTRFFIPVVVENSSGDDKKAESKKHSTSFAVGEFAFEKAIFIFSNITDFQQQYPDARPLPMLGADLANFAIQLQVPRFVLDKGNTDILVGRQAVFAIADGTAWTPSWNNEQLYEQVAIEFERLAGAVAFTMRCGKRCETQILVAFDGDEDFIKQQVVKVRELLSNFQPLLRATDSIEIIPLKA